MNIGEVYYLPLLGNPNKSKYLLCVDPEQGYFLPISTEAFGRA